MNESTSNTPEAGKEDSLQDMIDFMGKEDESPNKEEKGKKETKNEKVEDGKEEDEESKEDDEEHIELKDDEEDDEDEKKTEEDEDEVLAIPVKKSVILAKYPKLFKDFPILEKTYYGHQKFAEVFATPEDASEAAEKLEGFAKLEHSIIEEGNLIGVLSAVKEANPDAFNKIADNYFEMLGQVSPEAQYHVISGVMKGLIRNMMKIGNQQGERGEPLKEAAHIINQYLFNDGAEVTPHQKLSKETPESEEARKLKSDRENFTRERYETARDGMNDKLGKILRSTINQNIDPKGGMSDYVKRHAINECVDIVNNLIREDKPFLKNLDKLWSNAFQNNFNANSLDQIRKAMLSKAKTLLPGALKKVRNDAIRGLDNTRTEKDRRGPLTPGKSSAESSSRGNKPKEVDTRGMNTLDALNALMGD